jgi:hypothetical protein
VYLKLAGEFKKKKEGKKNMTAILEKSEVQSLWARFAAWVVSTENRLYIGWFGKFCPFNRKLLKDVRLKGESLIRFICRKFLNSEDNSLQSYDLRLQLKNIDNASFSYNYFNLIKYLFA